MLLAALAVMMPSVADAARPVILEKHGYVSTEPRLGSQSYIKQIHADTAWDVTRGSGDIVVALIDSSADRNHLDLKGVPRVVNSLKGTYGADYHGTHTAGILAAKHNRYGIAGLAPNVRYHFYNVFYGQDSELTDSWTVARAVDTAVAKGATIINLSLGGQDFDSVLAEALKRARAKGVILVASSGNEGLKKTSFPANLNEVIAVGAVDSTWRVARFSNMDASIRVVAPGVNILSLGVGNRFAYLDGTSMAAPMVSASIALAKSINPYLTPAEVEGLLGKMKRPSGKTYTELDMRRLLDVTPRPVTVSIPSRVTNRSITGVTLSSYPSKNMKASYSLYQGTKKVKTLTGTSFTMHAQGDWLPSGQYRLVGDVTNGKHKRSTSRSFTYTNPVKTTIEAESLQTNELQVIVSRKGTVSLIDASGKVRVETTMQAGKTVLKTDTTKPMTIQLKPSDPNERTIRFAYTPTELTAP